MIDLAAAAKRVVHALILAGMVLISAGAAQAQLTLTLDHPDQSGLAGQPLTFSGTLTNAGTVDLTVLSDGFGFASPDFTFDDTPFFDSTFPGGASLVLAGGEAVDLPLFELLSDPGAPFGSLAGGVFSVQATDVIGQLYDTGDQAFTAAVVPEQSTSVLLGIGLLVLGARIGTNARRHRRSSSPAL